MRQIEKSLGRPPKELADAPKLSDSLAYLWSIYVQLKNAAEGQIGYNDIKAYAEFYGDLTAWEVDTIRTLDDTHAQEMSKNG